MQQRWRTSYSPGIAELQLPSSLAIIADHEGSWKWQDNSKLIWPHFLHSATYPASSPLHPRHQGLAYKFTQAVHNGMDHGWLGMSHTVHSKARCHSIERYNLTPCYTYRKKQHGLSKQLVQSWWKKNSDLRNYILYLLVIFVKMHFELWNVFPPLSQRKAVNAWKCRAVLNLAVYT